MTIAELMKYAVSSQASDMYAIANRPLNVRVKGELVTVDAPPMSAEAILHELESLLTAEQMKRFQDEKECDAAIVHDGVRFRINVHMQEGLPALAGRVILSDIPSAEALRFEPALTDASSLLDGLVLVVGPTGHGKSTTIARMIEHINESRKSHIITIEDPIEFLFQEKQSIIEQREVGSDTTSFDAALKHVLRQDPNVIMVGEMRDPETIATVLTAAETGHLVFSTLHTGGAAEAIERIVDVFEGPKQKQVLIQLSSVLRMVVAQQLIPSLDGGRVAAREILINTPAVANMIRENNIAQIQSAIQTGVKDNMMTMDASVMKLLEDGRISQDMAERRTGRARMV